MCNLRIFDYPVTVDDDAVLVTFADALEAITFGMDEDKALLQAVDAHESALAFYINDRKLLPTLSKERQKDGTPFSFGMRQVGWLSNNDRGRGITKAELARRLDWRTPQIDRLLTYKCKKSRIQDIAECGISL